MPADGAWTSPTGNPCCLRSAPGQTDCLARDDTPPWVNSGNSASPPSREESNAQGWAHTLATVVSDSLDGTHQGEFLIAL